MQCLVVKQDTGRDGAMWGKTPSKQEKLGWGMHIQSYNSYRFRFLKNAVIEPPSPKKEKFEELAPAAIAPPVANRAMVPGSGVVPKPTAQLPVSTLLVSMVTAPFRAIALPQLMLAPVFRVMLWSAITLP
jgi:hypothetical protein